MSRIRSKDTKPEISVRKRLFAAGFRYRLHSQKLPGRPDIVVPKYRAVIFIDGCFWHGHAGCKFFKLPSTRQDWWEAKIQNNKKNDRNKRKELKALGWRIIQVWECQLKKDRLEKSVNRIVRKLLSQK